MTDEDVDNFKKVSDKIHIHLFKQALDYHKSLPNFAWFGETCKMDTIIMLNARFQGMIRLSKRKYGVYNKAADNKRCKMFKKCFPWW